MTVRDGLGCPHRSHEVRLGSRWVSIRCFSVLEKDIDGTPGFNYIPCSVSRFHVCLELGALYWFRA